MDDIEPIAGYPTKRAMLEALYTDECLSIKAIADRLGLGTATIERWMRLLNVPKRHRGGPNTPATLGWKMHRIDPRVTFTLTIKQLASLLGISEAYVYKFRKGATAIWTLLSFPQPQDSSDTRP